MHKKGVIPSITCYAYLNQNTLCTADMKHSYITCSRTSKGLESSESYSNRVAVSPTQPIYFSVQEDELPIVHVHRNFTQRKPATTRNTSQMHHHQKLDSTMTPHAGATKMFKNRQQKHNRDGKPYKLTWIHTSLWLIYSIHQ